MQCCRGLHAMVSSVPAIQYPVALAAYGLVDNKRSTHSIGEKLERAHLTYRAHRDFRWIPHFFLPLDGQRLEYPSSPLVVRSIKGTPPLSFVFSGSVARGVQDRYWGVNPALASQAFSYTCNPAEDLLILQTRRVQRPQIYFLTMSDGETHPRAALPFIEGQELGPELTTYGPYIITPGTYGAHALWNWKTGLMCTMIRCDYSSATFLNSDYLALVCGADDGLRLHIYRLPQAIFEVDAGVIHPPSYSFGLPMLSPANPQSGYTLRRSPTSVYMPGGSPDPGRDFHTDPNDALLTLHYEQRSPRLQYALVIGLRQLLPLLTPERLGQHSPWAEWGPERAHGSVERARSHTGWDEFTAFGMRYIGIYPTLRSDNVLVATIRDYHPRRVARARQELNTTNGHETIVDGGTVGGPWVGMAELETRLSYIETVVPLPEELQRKRGTVIALSINEDSIIASTGLIGTATATVHVYTI